MRRRSLSIEQIPGVVKWYRVWTALGRVGLEVWIDEHDELQCDGSPSLVELARSNKEAFKMLVRIFGPLRNGKLVKVSH